MWHETKTQSLLNIEYPIIQAGMAGGATTPELVAEVSNSGGLGTLGAGYMAPEQIRSAIQAIKALTDAPFAVNLFIPSPKYSKGEEQSYIETGLKLTERYRQNFNLEKPQVHQVEEDFDEQLNVILEEKVPCFSFTFGLPSADAIQKLKDRAITTLGTATTVNEAIELEKAGIDIVVAQGSEAGGHRGTFLAPSMEQAMIGTMALVPQIVDHVSVPVIASGGIMDGRGVAAALMLGASGVQMGTAFLTCQESGAQDVHKQKILHSSEADTILTKAFSGKEARGIANPFMEEMAEHHDAIPPYPIQNAVTKDIRKASGQQKNPDYMSLWAGQGTRLSEAMTAKELFDKLIEETGALFR
ncbi:NAD(P)H-dependent flavin oxidoreductase [Salicibibacter kimchii]|uniref:Probable nitronate monooxygenase n=1 Tax=Salicibibacter kimchii TaxID=2099786 RepID=A0A345BW29_9BACI|nr:nitronate monooxygenase [Salicibibacter kimchii]AXF55160.1 nitronate monooxygenase [Salicibibacter kimchii]